MAFQRTHRLQPQVPEQHQPREAYSSGRGQPDDFLNGAHPVQHIEPTHVWQVVPQEQPGPPGLSLKANRLLAINHLENLEA
jgi:hypothetical protein